MIYGFFEHLSAHHIIDKYFLFTGWQSFHFEVHMTLIWVWIDFDCTFTGVIAGDCFAAARGAGGDLGSVAVM